MCQLRVGDAIFHDDKIVYVHSVRDSLEDGGIIPVVEAAMGKHCSIRCTSTPTDGSGAPLITEYWVCPVSQKFAVLVGG